ncbi:MAG: hypothetical protein OJF47_001993 [Nitrospira sp.]|jgi:hypothetical protein|nr:MAG: hypothetical protein OJF47_001993 [Nitrospira sp.]
MRNLYGLRWLFHVSAVIVVAEICACAVVGALPFGGDSWQEEVLLHDGRKLVVERSQSYGGGHEIGQPSPIKEHSIAFMLPESGKRITWTSEYDESLGGTNLKPLALHILKNTPYIVVTPNLMLSYNKWGRPNPPYVFFKYEDGGWKRIGIETFPPEFKNINLVISTLAHRKILNHQGFVSLEMVAKLNSSLTQVEYKTIHRAPLEHWKLRPESKGPTTPSPMMPAETTQGNQ